MERLSISSQVSEMPKHTCMDSVSLVLSVSFRVFDRENEKSVTQIY